MTINVYQSVTDSIISQLEKGAAPWIKSWKTDSSANKNFITQEPYKGINTLITGMAGFNNPAWATYKQWNDKGAQVKKGEKATQIVFFKPVSKTSTNAAGESETKNYAFLTVHNIFNVEQTDLEIIPFENESAPFNPIPAIESKIRETGAIIKHGGDSAFYNPSNDYIQLPNAASFESEAHYYATAFHELAHWSSAKHRLDRKLGKTFGNPDYAFEELIAEISAAFLCADYKIQGDLRHAGYIQSWLKACRDDNKAIFKAAALAQKAADFIKREGAITESDNLITEDLIAD
jgi:antirestriction protein ArdC